MDEIKRGEIYWADFSPTVGSEQLGVRPALIIQNNIGNKFSKTVIVAIITKQNKNDLPTHVTLEKEKYSLDYDSVVMLEQIRTIDKYRIGEKISVLDPEKMVEVEKKIMISLGIENIFAKVAGSKDEYVVIPKQKLIELGLL